MRKIILLAVALIAVTTTPISAQSSGIASSADPRATEAGAEILAKGGSAADAAMAMMLALTVVEPQSSGIGGGGFLVHYDADGGKISTINGRETAPAAATPQRFTDANGKPIPFLQAFPGGKSVGVPGNIRLMAEAHRKWGKLKWAEIFKPEREKTRALMVAALNRSHNLPVDTGFVTDAVTAEWARKVFPNMLAYFIDHNDGFKTTLFLAQIQDFNYAGMRSDNGQIISCQMYLPMPSHSATTADFFSPLVRHIETMVIENRALYPVERTLLTSGMVIGGVDSIFNGYKPVDTPEMVVKYSVGPQSYFRNE